MTLRRLNAFRRVSARGCCGRREAAVTSCAASAPRPCCRCCARRRSGQPWPTPTPTARLPAWPGWACSSRSEPTCWLVFWKERPGGARGPLGPGRRQPAAHHCDLGAARRAERGAGGHRPGHRVAARRGRVADRADRAGAVQPARIAGPAGTRHPVRPFGPGDRGRLQPRREDAGGRLPGRHDPALGHRLASPGRLRDLGRRGGRARVHRRRQEPGSPGGTRPPSTRWARR